MCNRPADATRGTSPLEKLFAGTENFSGGKNQPCRRERENLIKKKKHK